MRVIILTSRENGSPAHHIATLLGSGACQVAMVVYNHGEVANKGRLLKRKLHKVLRIGPWGALNGFRMRKWFDSTLWDLPHGDRSIRDLCEQYGIPYRETPTINCDHTRALFQEARAELGISLGNSYIGQSVFSIPRHGMINIHHELLPAYQNAQSIIWQLHNRSKYTGYTIHRICARIDGGDMLLQETIPIHFGPTLRQTIAATSRIVHQASAQGLVEIIRHFEHYLTEARKQGPGHSYTTPTFRQFLRIHRNFLRLRQGH